MCRLWLLQEATILKRISIDIDLDDLSFSDSSQVTAALKVLEELASAGILSLEVTKLRGRGRIAKVRSDRKHPEDRKLNPQAESVLENLSDLRPKTVIAIATDLGMNPNSVRAMLHVLKDRSLVEQKGTLPSGSGSRPPKLWQKT